MTVPIPSPHPGDSARSYLARVTRALHALALAELLESLAPDDERVRLLDALPPFVSPMRAFPSERTIALLLDWASDTSADVLLRTVIKIEIGEALDAESREFLDGPET